MTRPRSLERIVRIWILACVGLVAGDRALGQGLDWASGFGVPGQGMDATVRALIVHDDGSGPALYAGGDFTHAGGVAANGVARWNGSSWSPVGGGVTNSVFSLASFDDGTGPALYAGGYVYTADGSPVSFIAKWNGVNWTGVGGGLDSIATAMSVHDEGTGPALFVGGAFSAAGGNPAAHVARWDGTSWSVPASGISTQVFALASFDDGSQNALYAGAVRPNTIRRWDGSTWSSVGLGLGGGGSVYVSALAASTGGLYAGGGFTTANGGAQPCNNVAYWDGTQWNALGAQAVGGGTNTVVSALQIHDDGSGPALFAGGGFDTADLVPANKAAKWDGTAWSALGTGLSGTSGSAVLAMAVFDDGSGPKLFAGGSFDHAGGKPSKYVAEWGVPVSAPTIVQQPASASAVFDDPVTFSVVADGTATLSFQWRKDGVPLVDVPQRLEGATTPRLSIYVWSFNDVGAYDCVVTNPLGSATSDAATLTVPVGGITGTPVSLGRILAPPEPVADHPGATYDTFFGPVEASTGEIAYFATIRESPQGSPERSLDLWKSGENAVLHLENERATGTPAGVVFGDPAFEGYVVGARGSVLFASELAGPGINSTNHKGLWFHDATGEDLVARYGDPAAGSPPGSTFQNVLYPYRLSDSGQAVFFGEAYLGGQFVENGCWRWDRSSGAQQVAVTGHPAPGTTDTFAGIEPSSIVQNGTGSVAFLGQLSGSGSFGIWTGDPASLQLVAQRGDSVPGLPAGSTFQAFNFVVIGESGDLAFQATVQDPMATLRRCLFRWSAGVFETLVSEGDAVPGAPGSAFFYPKPVAMNDQGSIVFFSVLSQGTCTGTCPSYGLWLSNAAGVAPLVTNHSDPLPEAPGEFVLGGLGGVAVDDLDQVVFGVRFDFGQFFYGVYGWTPDHGLFPVAVPGTQVEVSPGDFRTVLGANLPPVNGGTSGGGIQGESLSTNLNADARLVLDYRFTDQTTGIFEGRFATYAAQYFAPGNSFCAGDGSTGTPCPCANFGETGHGCQNSASTGGAILTSFGAASLAEDSVALMVSGERATVLRVFLQGTTKLVSGAVYGDGVRCIGGSLKRIGSKVAVGGVANYPGDGDLSISARSAHLGQVLQAGTTRYYQVAYRDANPSFCPSPPGGSINVSNGQSILWFP